MHLISNDSRLLLLCDRLQDSYPIDFSIFEIETTTLARLGIFGYFFLFLFIPFSVIHFDELSQGTFCVRLTITFLRRCLVLCSSFFVPICVCFSFFCLYFVLSLEFFSVPCFHSFNQSEVSITSINMLPIKL